MPRPEVLRTREGRNGILFEDGCRWAAREANLDYSVLDNAGSGPESTPNRQPGTIRHPTEALYFDSRSRSGAP